MNQLSISDMKERLIFISGMFILALVILVGYIQISLQRLRQETQLLEIQAERELAQAEIDKFQNPWYVVNEYLERVERNCEAYDEFNSCNKRLQEANNNITRLIEATVSPDDLSDSRRDLIKRIETPISNEDDTDE